MPYYSLQQSHIVDATNLLQSYDYNNPSGTLTTRSPRSSVEILPCGVFKKEFVGIRPFTEPVTIAI